MDSNRAVGDCAESIARQYIAEQGYIILDTNWYYKHLELDIVAQDKNQLVIVEVKSRNGIRYQHPSEAVTKKKIDRIIEATEAYILKNDLNLETRFDIITIIFTKSDFELEHFKDAFYPML